MSDAADDFRGVSFDLHAAAASITQLATCKLSVDGFQIDGKTSRKPFNNCNQRAAV